MKLGKNLRNLVLPFVIGASLLGANCQYSRSPKYSSVVKQTHSRESYDSILGNLKTNGINANPERSAYFPDSQVIIYLPDFHEKEGQEANRKNIDNIILVIQLPAC